MSNKKQIRLTESDLNQIVKETVLNVLNEMGGQGQIGDNMQQQQQAQQQTVNTQQQAQSQNNQLTQYQQAIWKFCQQVAQKMQENEKAIQRIDKGINAIWEAMQRQRHM